MTQLGFAAGASNDPRGPFLAALRRLVLVEAEATRRRIHQGWSRPVPERVASGLATESVRIAEARPDGTLALDCEHNQSRFREGDTLCLNRGNPVGPPHVLATLEADYETRLDVSLEDIWLNWAELLAQPEGWVLNEGYLDLSH